MLLNPDCSSELIGLNDEAGRPRYSFTRRVDYCSGACLMVRRELLQGARWFQRVTAARLLRRS